MRTITNASQILDCEAELVYEILIDYDDYFEWLTFLSNSRLLAKEKDLAIAEFEVQSPSSKLSVECIHTKNQGVLLRRISGDVPIQQIEWTIQGTGPGKCEVTLQVHSRRELLELFKIRRPRYWRAAAVLEALKSRCLTFSSSFPVTDEAGQKIVEAFESEDGLVLWVLGKKYVIQAVEDDE